MNGGHTKRVRQIVYASLLLPYLDREELVEGELGRFAMIRGEEPT